MEVKEFGRTRKDLLAKTFFVNQLILHLRKSLNIPLSGFKTPQEILSWEIHSRRNVLQKKDWPTEKGWGHKSETRILTERIALLNDADVKHYQPIFDILDKFHYLDLDLRLILALVLGYKDFELKGSNKIYLVTSPLESIQEIGVYVKFAPNLSDKEWLSLKREATEAYLLLQKILSPKPIKKIRPMPKKYQPTEKSLELYTLVEDAYMKNYFRNPNFCSLEQIFEEIAKQEGLSEASLKRIYYNIQEKYNLPSVTETSKIPK